MFSRKKKSRTCIISSTLIFSMYLLHTVNIYCNFFSHISNQIWSRPVETHSPVNMDWVEGTSYSSSTISSTRIPILHPHFHTNICILNHFSNIHTIIIFNKKYCLLIIKVGFVAHHKIPDCLDDSRWGSFLCSHYSRLCQNVY